MGDQRCAMMDSNGQPTANNDQRSTKDVPRLADSQALLANNSRSSIAQRPAQPTTTRGQIQTISFTQTKFVVSPSVFSGRVSKNHFATPFRFSSFPPRRHSPCCARVSRPRTRSDRRSQLLPLSHSPPLPLCKTFFQPASCFWPPTILLFTH
jgi:hypothetical protein